MIVTWTPGPEGGTRVHGAEEHTLEELKQAAEKISLMLEQVIEQETERRK